MAPKTIKFILNPGKNPVSTCFKNSDSILIGNDRSESAHFKISDPSLKDVHVKITWENGRFVITNAANDPFASLNNVPFGKKSLKNSDLLQIGDNEIRIEIPEQEMALTAPEKSSSTEKVKESSIEKANKDSELINALLMEVEQLGEKAAKRTQKEKSSEENSNPTENKQKKPEKAFSQAAPHEQPPLELGDSPPFTADDSFAALQEGKKLPKKGWNQNKKSTEENVSETFFSENWKMFTAIFFAVSVLTALVCGGIYFKASGKNSQEEKKIAAGTADIAMAMSHARLNNIVPGKQNWTNPEFIQNNLEAVLSPNLHTQVQINEKGQFTRYPYILRAYTNGDMSRFLVIAQPAPSLMQWLMNKKSIVIDSHRMEMRKIADLQKLNRLLANPDPLEGKNGVEIEKVIREGSLMPLASLSGNKNLWGFPPPKSLAYISPGAENYIYNAPRYYPFGEAILRKAISLANQSATAAEFNALKSEIEELANFSDLVLYTSQGLQAAIEGQKALAMLFPEQDFLVGYISFNSKGYVADSRIFTNEAEEAIALEETEDGPFHLPFESAASKKSKSESITLAKEKEEKKAFPDAERALLQVDQNHPLYLRLLAITASRSRALTPVGEEISALYSRQSKEIIPEFHELALDLSQKYHALDVKYQAHVVQELAALYQEYSDMPLEEFMRFIEASKLTPFIQEALKTHRSSKKDAAAVKEKIEKSLAAVEASDNLEDLDSTVQETANLLNLEAFPDPDSLIVFQETLHNTVLNKLSSLLFSPDTRLIKHSLRPEDRTTFVRTLKTAWITDNEEFDYFLSEFDYSN